MPSDRIGAVAPSGPLHDLTASVDRHAEALADVSAAFPPGPIEDRVTLTGDPGPPSPEAALVEAITTGRALEAQGAVVRAEDERLAALAFLVAHHEALRGGGDDAG